MKKKIYLHIGPHRTATTSSQIMFSEMAVPENTAFYYPSTGRSVENSQYGHNLVFSDAFFFSGPLFAELMSEIESCGSEKILLSAENFYSIDPLQLRRSFEGYEVQIIYTKRNVFDWIVSVIAFNVMHGLRMNLLEFFRNAVVSNVLDETSATPYERLDFFNWSSRLNRWHQVFGSQNITCVQFGTQYPYIDILAVVCDSSQLELITRVELRINQSLTLPDLLRAFEKDGTKYRFNDIPIAQWIEMAEEFSTVGGEDFPVNSLFCYKLLSMEFDKRVDEDEGRVHH
jgi:hypothetical protein